MAFYKTSLVCSPGQSPHYISLYLYISKLHSKIRWWTQDSRSLRYTSPPPPYKYQFGSYSTAQSTCMHTCNLLILREDSCSVTMCTNLKVQVFPLSKLIDFPLIQDVVAVSNSLCSQHLCSLPDVGGRA